MKTTCIIVEDIQIAADFLRKFCEKSELVEVKGHFLNVADALEFLDREKHPFFEHGKAEFFLARRDGEIVGRIFNSGVSVARPWMWTLDIGHHEHRSPTHGYDATREAAMAAFAKSWRRE